MNQTTTVTSDGSAPGLDQLRDTLDKTLARAYERFMHESASMIVHSCFDIILKYRSQGMPFELIAKSLGEMGITIKAPTLTRLFTREQKRRLQAQQSFGKGEEQKGSQLQAPPAQAPAMEAPAPAPAPAVAKAPSPDAAPASAANSAPAPAAIETQPATPVSSPAPKAAPATTAPAPAAPVAKTSDFRVGFANDIYPPEIIGKSGKAVRVLPRKYIKLPKAFGRITLTPEEIEEEMFERSIRPLVKRIIHEIPPPEKEYEPLKPLRMYTDRNGKTWDVLSDMGPRVDHDMQKEHMTRTAHYLSERREFLESLGLGVSHGSDMTPRYTLRPDLRPSLKLTPEELERIVQEHLEP
jgi:hypothetical protein